MRAPAHRAPTASHWHQRCILAARMSSGSAGLAAAQGTLLHTMLLALRAAARLVIRMGMGLSLICAPVQSHLCPDSAWGRRLKRPWVAAPVQHRHSSGLCWGPSQEFHPPQQPHRGHPCEASNACLAPFPPAAGTGHSLWVPWVQPRSHSSKEQAGRSHPSRSRRKPSSPQRVVPRQWSLPLPDISPRETSAGKGNIPTAQARYVCGLGGRCWGSSQPQVSRACSGQHGNQLYSSSGSSTLRSTRPPTPDLSTLYQAIGHAHTRADPRHPRSSRPATDTCVLVLVVIPSNRSPPHSCMTSLVSPTPRRPQLLSDPLCSLC